MRAILFMWLLRCRFESFSFALVGRVVSCSLAFSRGAFLALLFADVLYGFVTGSLPGFCAAGRQEQHKYACANKKNSEHRLRQLREHKVLP